MDFDKLRILSQFNEIRIDNHARYKRNPPHYYNSLRHGLNAYFKTFQTHNAMYDYYASGYRGSKNKLLPQADLDEDNTMLCMVGLSRFFELFYKDILGRVNARLVQIPVNRQPKTNKIGTLVNQINLKTFNPKKFENRLLSIPFREALDRFYGLCTLAGSTSTTNPIVKKFSRTLNKYPFLNTIECKASMELLTWYRDRILHNGNRLPSPWLLDYLITQRFMPIIKAVIEAEKEKLGKSMFYGTTQTGIDIFDELCSLKTRFEFKDLRDSTKDKTMFVLLLYIGHLKEMGRANLKVNLNIRQNRATHEYNYRDPIGRGQRFAKAEQVHEHFKQIKKCPCCGIESMVIYSEETHSFTDPNDIYFIEWLKCYTCDYHLRYNVGDPQYFGLSTEEIFNVK